MSLRSQLTELFWHHRMERDAGPFDPSQVKKILVVRNDNIGDVLCTTPAVTALREAFPKAHIAALVCTLTQDAIEGHPDLDALYVYPKAKHKVHGPLRSHLILARLLGRLKKENFDLAVAFRSTFSGSQAWLAYASGARWRLGVRAGGKRAGMGFYYNLPADPPPGDMHEVRRCFHLLKQISVDTEPKSLYLKVPGPALSKMRKLLNDHGINQAGPPVVVNVTRCAYSPQRTWSEQNWKALLQGLSERGLPLVVTHAPADRSWAEGILKGLEPVPPVFWSKSLKEFGAMASLGRLFVTAEGGTMHIGAAVGVPQIVLWGYTSLDNWRPWSDSAMVIESGGDVANIQVDDVIKAVCEKAMACSS